MPFSSIKDPVDLARAQGALDAAWRQLQDEKLARSDEDRHQLAHIIACFAETAIDEEELVKRAVSKFRASVV